MRALIILGIVIMVAVVYVLLCKLISAFLGFGDYDPYE
jgi:hypothetical protein